MHRFQSLTKSSNGKRYKGGKGNQHVVGRKNATFIPSPRIPAGNGTDSSFGMVYFYCLPFLILFYRILFYFSQLVISYQ